VQAAKGSAMTGKSGEPFDPREWAAKARRLLEERRMAFEARMAEARARMEDRRAFHERRLAEMAERLAERRGGRALGNPRKKRSKDEGGEPVPAVPRPKPMPLAGGAAAPLDPERRRTADGVSRKETHRGRTPTDAETRQSL
jgi:hypothetical protein